MFEVVTAMVVPPPVDGAAPAWSGVPVGCGLPIAGDVADTVALLAVAPPDPQTIAVLAATDPLLLGVDGRLDLVRAWERAAAWVAAQSLSAVAALTAPDVGPDPTPPALRVPDVWREELACAVTVSGAEAQHRLDLAADLQTRLAATAAALAAGEVSAAKAEVISRGVAVLGTGTQADAVAAAVEAAVLPDAAMLTVPQLRRAVARAVIAADPAGAVDRAETARETRGVAMFPLPEGMAGLWADLPAADAHTVMLGLDTDADRAAATLRAAGQPVPGQSARRADALLAWAHRALAAPAPPTVQGRQARVHVTVAVTTLLGLDDLPAELDGYGPIDAHTARRIAADATWTRLLTDPATGALLDYGRTTYHPPADLRDYILTRDPTCTFPGCLRPSRRCHLDHIHEWHHDGRTCKHNLHPLCHRHHTCKSSGDWTVTRDPDGAHTWTSPTGAIYTRPPHQHTPQTLRPAAPTTPRAGPPVGPDPPATGQPGPPATRDPDDDPPPF